MIVFACRPVPLGHPAIAWLDAAERLRLGRYRREHDASAFATGRILLRAVGATEYDLDPRLVPVAVRPRGHPEAGRPFLPGRPGAFSLSHSGGAVVLARRVAGPVGVDVEERVDQAVDALTSYFPSAEAPERGWDLPSLHRDWVRREAVLKCLGVGLTRPPGDLVLGPADGAPRVLHTAAGLADAPRLRVRDLDIDGRPGALASLDGPRDVLEVGDPTDLASALEPLAVSEPSPRAPGPPPTRPSTSTAHPLLSHP